MSSADTPRSRRAAHAAAAMVLTFLVFAAPAAAMLTEGRPSGTPTDQAPTIVKETVVGPASGAHTTLVYALAAVGLVIAPAAVADESHHHHGGPTVTPSTGELMASSGASFTRFPFPRIPPSGETATTA